MTKKVMIRKALQRDDADRAAYSLEIEGLDPTPEMMCFFDETGVDGRTERRSRGWALKGRKATITELLHNGQHYSVLALYGITGFIDHDFVEGGYTADDVLTAFEWMIVPHLGNYLRREPNSVIIGDNCSAHHTFEAAITNMVESAGARIVFLAPYSPIDNPIEKGFDVSKAFWKRERLLCANMSVSDRIQYCLDNCYKNPKESAAATYKSCGII